MRKIDHNPDQAPRTFVGARQLSDQPFFIHPRGPDPRGQARLTMEA